MKANLLKITIFAAASLAIASCKKSYLDVVPNNAITPQQAFSSLTSVNSSLTSEYNSIFAYGGGSGGTGHDNFGHKQFDLASDLMGNDMIESTQGYGWFNADYQYTEWVSPNATRRSDNSWSFYYNIIEQSNLILTNVGTTLAGATKDDIDRIKGEALALRAWSYYYLVNDFQQTYKGNESKPGVPLVITITTQTLPRAKVSDVYTQIIADLTQAETLLTGKTRPSKSNIDVHTVQGIRARVALIMEDWTTAATYANKARQGYAPMPSTTYNTRSAFSTIGTAEWMWGGLISAAQATVYASFFSHMDATNGGYAALGMQKKITKALYDQIPSTDIRKKVFAAPGTGTSTVPDYCQIKHEVPVVGSWAADYLYMRAAEMYLIEAEALARQGGQDGAAQTVLQALISTRNPSYNATSFSGMALINEILLQRRIELWGEGFSLIDIKRTHAGLNRPSGPGNHGAPNFNPIVYQLPDAAPTFLMHIPQREIDNNASMTAADQNP